MDSQLFSNPVLWWFSLCLIFGMLELLSGDFILLSISTGLLGGGIAAVLGFPVSVQFITFALFSLIFYIGIRPLFKQYLTKSTPDIKMNIDSLKNADITVTEISESNSSEGFGKIYGDMWKVQHVSGKPLNLNQTYKVIDVVSIRLIITDKES